MRCAASLGLTAETLARPVRTLSGGTRQKLSAVIALRHEAPVLILDEPTAGLDPLTSSHLKELVRQRAASGAAVLLTSHVMAEVEELADVLVYLVDGRVRFQRLAGRAAPQDRTAKGRACHRAPDAGGGVSAARKVLGYSLSNLLRNWWVLGYGLLFLLLTEALFRFRRRGPTRGREPDERGADRHPARQRGVRDPVLLQFARVHRAPARAAGGPAVRSSPDSTSAWRCRSRRHSPPVWRCRLLPHGGAGLLRPVATLVAAGVLLTFVFTSVAFLAGVHFEDRAKGLGFALLVWFCCAVLYDGLILLVATMFRDYPLEPALLALTVLNPVDLARVLLLLTLDAAALMGYTGAVFGRFFGSALGIAAAAAALLLWTAVPFLLGLRGFNRKDF